MSDFPCSVEINLPDGRTRTYVAFAGILPGAFARIANQLWVHPNNEFPPVPTGWSDYEGPAKEEHKLNSVLTM